MATLYRKYRPEHWSEVSGQSHIITTLTNALKGNLLVQAYLFTGPRGTGKTTVARLLAQSANCTNRTSLTEPCGECPHCRAFKEGRAFDIIEIDGASNNSVENVRELRETVKLPPTLGTKKIYIIDEAHMLSAGAWNALLKTLEEPPSHVIFILATTELHKIPDTILSRCQRFDFGSLSTDTIAEKLSRIADKEGVTVDPDAIEMIALAAEGGMRDAESLLSQVIALEDTHITGAETASILGISERKTVLDFVSALGERDLDAAILTLEGIATKGADFRSFAGALTHFVRELLFRKLGEDARETLASRAFAKEHDRLTILAQQFSFQELARLMELIHHARKEIRHAAIEHIPLEIATLAFLYPEDLATNRPPETTSIASRTSPASLAPSDSSALRPSPSTHTTKTPHPKEEGASHPTPPPAQDSTPAASRRPHSQATVETPKSAGDRPINNGNASPPLTVIQEKWPAFLVEIKRRNASLSLSLTDTTPRLSENGAIGVAVRHAFHKERLEKPESRLTVEEALATIFETPLHLTIEVASEKPSSDDPLLNSALTILGGKVVS